MSDKVQNIIEITEICNYLSYYDWQYTLDCISDVLEDSGIITDYDVEIYNNKIKNLIVNIMEYLDK